MSTASDASAAVAAASEPSAPTPLSITAYGLAVVAVLAGLGDWLFYGHQIVGISLVVFMVALAASTCLTNPIAGLRGAVALATVLLVAGLLPHAVNPSALSVLFAVAGAAYFAVVVVGKSSLRLADRAIAVRSLLADCGWRATGDILKAGSAMAQSGRRPHANVLIVWVVPLTMSIVFVWLFANANPLIAGWLDAIDLPKIVSHINGKRTLFWLIVISLVWPFVFFRAGKPRAADKPKPIATGKEQATIFSPHLFGRAAILRSLMLFNALFAVQSILDAAYLWGGVVLPGGMDYAEYAHRGAYPLIVTALLAAGFVIVSLTPGSETERSPVIRALVYLWIAQNVGLVISSILRLDLYVSVYSLTYWRVAAFVWMLLVAMGLALILARIALRRPNDWLIKANLISLAVTLYVCAFINLPSLVAEYNVRHSLEVSGQGLALDRRYFLRLGPHAIPALDEFIARLAPSAAVPEGDNSRPSWFPNWRETWAREHQRKRADWRAWSYWDWRLAQYLERTAPQAATPPVPAP